MNLPRFAALAVLLIAHLPEASLALEVKGITLGERFNLIEANRNLTTALLCNPEVRATYCHGTSTYLGLPAKVELWVNEMGALTAIHFTLGDIDETRIVDALKAHFGEPSLPYGRPNRGGLEEYYGETMPNAVWTIDDTEIVAGRVIHLPPNGSRPFTHVAVLYRHRPKALRIDPEDI